MNFDNDNNESELLNKVYVSQEGCFLYLRDEKMSQTPNFLTFIEVCHVFQIISIKS